MEANEEEKMSIMQEAIDHAASGLVRVMQLKEFPAPVWAGINFPCVTSEGEVRYEVSLEEEDAGKRAGIHWVKQPWMSKRVNRKY